MIRVPTSTPNLLVRLYSIAGANPNASLDLELGRMDFVGSAMS